MLNYMKSEWYRLKREQMIYIYTAIFVGMVLAAGTLLGYMNHATKNFPYGTTRFLFINICSAMPMAFMFIGLFLNTIIGDEIKNHTLKNTVSFGIGRNVIYVGKMISSMVVTYLIGILSVLTAIGIGSTVLENSGAEFIKIFLEIMISMIPIMFASICTYEALLFLFENVGTISLIFMAIYMAIPMMMGYLGYKVPILFKLYRLTPWFLMSDLTMLEDGHFYMAGNTPKGMITCWLVGLVYAGVSFVIGYECFKKKEIK